MLRETDIFAEMRRIKAMGFVRTKRVGDTGVGFTLETLLGLRETNVRGRQDLAYQGEPVELKSQRRGTASMMTLFTMEPRKGGLDDRRMIDTYGYRNAHNRRALKVTLTTTHFVPQGLKLEVDVAGERLVIVDQNGNRPWYWAIADLKPKIGRLLVVFADVTGTGQEEAFHYNEAYYLTELNSARFFALFDAGALVVDLRMHLKLDGTVRNRGTAFRIRGFDRLVGCYAARIRVI